MADKSDLADIRNLQDIRTPFGKRLSGIYKKSFAYITIKDRLPVILTKVIDTLSRSKEEIAQKYGEGATEEIKKMVGFISELKNEIVTNKCLKPLELLPNITDSDAIEWNEYLKKQTEIENGVPTWFNTLWLYCECYMYRRLVQQFYHTEHLNSYDYFEQEKQNVFINSLASVQILSQFAVECSCKQKTIIPTNIKFSQFLKFSLWGNKCDLSLSAGAGVKESTNPIDTLSQLDDKILVNDSQYVYELLRKNTNKKGIIDIVLDNAGYELFTDLCLAMFFITHNYSTKVRFYVKRYPWYVSDATQKDFQWTLDYMLNSSIKEIAEFGSLCVYYLKSNIWTIEEEPYWTGPYEFVEMKDRDPKLYAKLSEANLVIFKGDLNYRKLLSDINWEYSTTFTEALRNFLPTNILSLRVIKSDVCVGLTDEVIEERLTPEALDLCPWLYQGTDGLIQASGLPDSV